MAADLRGRDLLAVADLDREDLEDLLELGAAIKAGTWTGRPLAGRHVCLLFQHPSHRTRVSFEVGVSRLGGAVVALGESDVRLGVRESVADAARVLDGYVHAVVARMRSHADLLDFATASRRPVINALTDRGHPCQVLADLLTLRETLGEVGGRSLAYVGDGNNVANSLVEAAALVGLNLMVVTPEGREPDPGVLEWARANRSGGGELLVTSDLGVVRDVDAIYTDVWASMGQEDQGERRRAEFSPYQVNRELMELCPRACFMHCLPAHRGEEVTAEVIDGDRSVVFAQAENRLYMQMALMARVLG